MSDIEKIIFVEELDKASNMKTKILIAEDDRDMALSLERVLHKADYEVFVTRDGNEAWDLLQRDDAPKRAVLDWKMPGMSGVEVCRKLIETNVKFRPVSSYQPPR